MKAIIVEDEIPAREELAYLIETYSEIEITDCFEDGLDVLKFLQVHETDAIFLDINIPSLDGMLLAGSISKFAHKPYIIFTTAYKEHAVQAFELEAFDYILKPYEEKRIAAMLKRLEAAYKREHSLLGEEGAVPRNGGLHRKERVNLRKGEKIIVADANDIFYCAAQEKITLVYTQQETLMQTIFFTAPPRRKSRLFIHNRKRLKCPWRYQSSSLFCLRIFSFAAIVLI